MPEMFLLVIQQIISIDIHVLTCRKSIMPRCSVLRFQSLVST
jgi:hypothetical protein